MTTKEAFLILLRTSGCNYQTPIKKAYRKAAMKYHPDRNPGYNDELMKMINNAFFTLKEKYGV